MQASDLSGAFFMNEIVDLRTELVCLNCHQSRLCLNTVVSSALGTALLFSTLQFIYNAVHQIINFFDSQPIAGNHQDN